MGSEALRGSLARIAGPTPKKFDIHYESLCLLGGIFTHSNCSVLLGSVERHVAQGNSLIRQFGTTSSFDMKGPPRHA